VPTTAPANADIAVLCTLGIRSVLVDIADAFSRAKGLSFAASYQSTNALMDRIAEGESADLAVITDTAIETLIKQRKIHGVSRRDLASAGIGLAVRAGMHKPDISTPETLKRALLAAKSVTYTVTGASGIHFAQMIKALGIAEEITAKATIRDGLAGELAARGDVEIAVQQISELMQVKGIDIIGPLPGALQKMTVFSAGIFTTTKKVNAAAALIDWLSTPATAAIIKAKGLTPLQV
jgi:molybdate transport system substrate-binding protein